MLLVQSNKLHPSTIHELAALIYGGVFTPVRAPDEIEQFFQMAGVTQDCKISIDPSNSTRFEIMGQIINILERLNTGSGDGETGFRQLSPGMELVIIYLVDPREYGRDLNVVTNISIRLNEILKFEKILVTLDESDGYTPKILPYSHDKPDITPETKNTTMAGRVNAAKAALKLTKEESDFNLKYAFYSIFGLALVVMIVLVITNYSKAAFSGADVILLFLLVSVIVLSLFGFGLNIFTRGEYRRFLENMIALIRQLRP
jgi:hypothetical protein